MQFPALPKPPKFTDIRECACLLLLCGAMIFSVLNIAIHRLTEKLWVPINIGLSPDGKEYFSISRAGLRVHDVETQKEIQRVTWRSPWRDHWMGKLQEEKPLNLWKDRESSFYWRWSENSAEMAPSIVVSPSRRYVIGRFPGGCCVWWDRTQQSARVISFPNHMLLRCFIDEARDVVHFESTRIPPPVMQRACLPPPQSPKREPVLNRKIDVIELQLSTGKKRKTVEDIRAGMAINNTPNIRLCADQSGHRVEMQTWEHFPEGVPHLASLVGCDEVAELAEFRIEKTPEGVSIFSPTYGGSYEELRLDPFSARVLSHRAENSPYGWGILSPSGAFSTYSPLDDVEAVVAVQDENDASMCRFCSVEDADFWCDAKVTSANGANLVRSANDAGQIVDCPRQSGSTAVWRRLHLNPYPNILFQSVVVMELCAVVWAVNAFHGKRLIAEHGWLLLLIAAIWPAYCWGVALAYETVYSGKFLMATSAVAGLLMLVCGVQMMSRGPVCRPAVMAIAFFVGVLIIWMLVNVGEYQSAQAY